MKAYLCTSCGVHYGARIGKPKFGFCSGCWDLHLAQERFNIRVAFVKRCEGKGEVPHWDFSPPVRASEVE